MKTIEERAKEFAMDAHDFDCEGCDTCSKCRDYRMFVDIATEQKAIDNEELLKLKSAWEREAQINHNDEANYQQGYHDAIEMAFKWLKARNVLTDDDSIMGFIKAMGE